MSQNFKNELELKKHFHEIHDFIRNCFGFYGKTALQFFNLLFVLKIIEPLIKNNQFNELKDCIFSKLLTAPDGSHRSNLLKEYRRAIHASTLRDSIFMATPFDDFDNKNDHLLTLLKMIDKIDSETMEYYHVNGRVYEYFLGFLQEQG